VVGAWVVGLCCCWAFVFGVALCRCMVQFVCTLSFGVDNAAGAIVGCVLGSAMCMRE